LFRKIKLKIQISFLQKLKSLYHQNRKFSVVLILLISTFSLSSIDLSENDIFYFNSLSGNSTNKLELLDILTHSAVYGSNAIRLRAAFDLSELGFEVENYEIVSEICTNLLDDGYKEIRLLENLFDSFYYQDDYESIVSTANKYLLKNSPSILKQIQDESKSVTVFRPSLKIEYYSFLAKLHGDSGSGSEYFRDFLIDNKTSEWIQDAYSRIQEKGIILPDSTTYLADFKIQFFKKNYFSAGHSMMKILSDQKKTIINTLESGFIVDNEMLSPIILDEMYKIAVTIGKRADLLGIIEELISIPGKNGYEQGEVFSYELISGLYESAGFLKRAKGSFISASDMFMAGIPFANGPKYEKMLWYWYNSLFKYSPELAYSQISLLTDKWTDPDYFSDILSELATYFVQQGKWSTIREILNVIESSGSDDSISKYSYLTARAGIEGFISISMEEINRLMTLSYNSGFGIASGLYYRILAGNYLRIFDIRRLPWMFNRTVSRDPLILNAGMKGSEELIFGLLQYGYLIDAYNYLMDNPFSNFDLVRRTALNLAEEKNFTRSIRLLNRYSRMNGFNLTISDLKLIYPDAYNIEIKKMAEKENIEWSVFTALVREESHFQSKVVSSAGAIGLSQLMPSTAADVAERLRISNYDLEDAQTNLSFGAWYLGNLSKRTDVLSDALFSYNGGLTRLRRWREEYSNLPDDLFLEAIPYKETSHYGRKLLVSSVIYAYLYDGIQPNEIISQFYRN
jgi:soluble lytic murein transglycosylase-like protein